MLLFLAQKLLKSDFPPPENLPLTKILAQEIQINAFSTPIISTFRALRGFFLIFLAQETRKSAISTPVYTVYKKKQAQEQRKCHISTPLCWVCNICQRIYPIQYPIQYPVWFIKHLRSRFHCGSIIFKHMNSLGESPSCRNVFKKESLRNSC